MEKLHLLARNDVRKNSIFSSVTSIILSKEYSYSDILLVHLYHLVECNNRLFYCNRTCDCIATVSVTSASRYVPLVSRYESRPLMYSRGLIPRNWPKHFRLMCLCSVYLPRGAKDWSMIAAYPGHTRFFLFGSHFLVMRALATDRRQSKTPLTIDICGSKINRSSVSIAICRQSGDKWQSKIVSNDFFYLRLSPIVLTVSIAAYLVGFDCRQSGGKI